MLNLAHSLFPSNVCCPQGSVAQNGVCYCSKEQSASSPFACGVICESLNLTLPPANGGCECSRGLAGERCDQKPCYVFSQQWNSIKLYCLDRDSSTASDCSSLGNLVPAENYTSIFSSCPCLNGGLAVSQEISHSCLCPDPFVGDLCQIEPYDASSATTTDPVTANTFLAIIALALLAVTIAICCGRRHQRRRRRKMENDFHRHDIAQAEYRRSIRRPTDIFASYVPLFPNILTSLENSVLMSGGSKKMNSKDEYQLVEVRVNAPEKEDAEKEKKNAMVFEHSHHDMIKKGPS